MVASMTSQAVDLNLRAVNYLQSSRYDEAARVLRRSLRLVLDGGRKTGSSSPNNSADLFLGTPSAPMNKGENVVPPRPHKSGGNFAARNNKNASRIFTAPIHDGSMQDLDASPDNIFPFFTRAFVLVHPDDVDPNAHEYRSETTAVLLYNIGLSYHSKGVTKGGSKRLEYALEFYHLALTTLEESQELPVQECSEKARFIILALLTNMAHIYSHFYESSEACTCRELIPELLAAVPFETTVMGEDEYVFFFMAIHVYNDINLVNAPAA